ncbi:MAG: hypothetical protein HYT90_04455 [Candidatus Omnitrophica bacterium]|nr:hypothetical protein [Candidatus Omnitrophota bacterium]
MDVRRSRRVLLWCRRFALALALVAIALTLWQGKVGRGLRHRWRPFLPAAEQHDFQPMPRWHVDRG